MDPLATLRLLAAAVLGVLGLLAVLRAPHRSLWIPAIVATEAGHLLAPVALLLALLPRASAAETGASLLCGSAALLLASPWVRAGRAAAAAEAGLEAAIGTPPALSAGGAPPRAGPLRWRAGLGPRAPGVEVQRHTYDAARGLTLDLFQRPELGLPQPVVLMVHGGSWKQGDSTQLPWLNRYLAARGVSVAALNYRLIPEHRFPAQREDVCAAAAFLRARSGDLGLDPERLVLMGRSAGAHLALSAGYHPDGPPVRGIISLYAPTDLHWSWDNPGSPWVIDTPGTLRELLGGSPEEVAEAYTDASPLAFVRPGLPPTLLLHGGRDELVSRRQGQRLASALDDADVLHLHLELPAATHAFEGWGGGPGGQLTCWAVERFLGRILG